MNLISITNWYILVIVDFCFINIEGELIIRLFEAIELSNYIKTYMIYVCVQMNVVYELCCQWLLLQNKNSKRTSIVDFIEVRLFALILFLIYKYIKSLHRIPFLKLLSLGLSKSLTLWQHLFIFLFCLQFSLSGAKSSKAYSSVESFV